MLERKYVAPPTVWDFIQSDAFVCGIVGPYGSGKSVGAVMKMLRHSMEQKPDNDGVRRTRWAVVRNTRPMLRETTIKTFLDWIPEKVTENGRTRQIAVYSKTEGRFTLGRDDKGRLTMPHYRNGQHDGTYIEAEFIFMPLDKPQQEKNLLSLELTGAWVNEFREINFQLFTGLLGRTGRYPSTKGGPGATWNGVIADSNPMMEDGAYYKYFVERQGAEATEEALKAEGFERAYMEYFKQPGGLSRCAENITNLKGGRQYYILMGATAQSEGKSDAWIKVHRDAEYGVIIHGRPIYEKDYNEAIHVSKKTMKPDPKLAMGIGLDFGLTPAAVFGQRDMHGRWRIFGELVTPESNQLGAQQFLEQMMQHLRKHWGDVTPIIMADPAGQQRAQTDMKTCFGVAKGMGLKIYPSVMNLEPRIGSVRAALTTLVQGQPRLVIDHSATVLRQGFQGGYQNRRMQVSDERYADKPDKNKFSHVQDAIQYLIAGYDAPLLQNKAPRRFPTQYSARNRAHKQHQMNTKWNPVA